jgi:filamentous hemagglutinin family protein
MLIPCDRALAQSNIVPDATLGAESSVVIPLDPDLPVDVIEGGAQREQNLFHSFQEFNVSENRGAYFYSPDAAIQNILARVTGSNGSAILGTLGTFGESQPSLFLINPNGIIFGLNANLDIGGSFVATTANAVGLGETGRFSASEPQTSNLLAINPNAFFFNQFSNQGQIVNRSTATSTVLGFSVNGLPFTYGLQVFDGRSLLLLGGNVNIEGGIVFAPGGRVELGGLAGAGTVGLDTNGNLLSLSFPDGVARADISLNNQAVLDVVANDGGSIAIHARNINVFGKSKLWAGIWSGLGTVDSQAGDITLDATNAVTVVDSKILNEVQEQAIGNGGNINIRAGSLSLSGDSDYVIVSADTYGQGNSGSVSVQVSGPVSLNSSRISSQVLYGAVGNSGGIDIQARALRMTDVAELYTQVAFATGNAGDISIKVADDVELIDGSVIATYAGNGAVGNGGNITIEARSLFMKNNASLLAETLAQGNAGNILVKVTGSVTLINDSQFLSSVYDDRAVGNGGNITIEARSLFMADGSELEAPTKGQGNAGNILVRATDSIVLIDSHILSQVEIDKWGYWMPVGNGGDITIETGLLLMSDGSELISSTSGQGNAGNMKITARDTISFDGESRYGNASGAFSTVENTAKGNGGNIEITAGSLYVTNGAEISTSTFGRGNAGDIKIATRDQVSFSGEGSDGFANGAISVVAWSAEGKGGDIEIATGSLFVTNGAQIDTFTVGRGDAGNVKITARDTVFFDGRNSNGIRSGAASSVVRGAIGNGGNLEITTDSLFITNGAQLNASTGGQGNSGDIRLDARQVALIAGNSSVSTLVSEGAVASQPSAIEIQTQQLALINGSNITASTAGQGDAGSISVRDARAVLLFDSNISTESRSSSLAGDITIDTQLLTLADNSEISAATVSSQGGDITLKGSSTLRLINSLISASTETGVAGEIKINATDSVQLFGTGGLSVEATLGGEAGDLTVTTRKMTVSDEAAVTVSSPKGQAGNLTITADSLFLNRGTILAETGKSSPEGGANITLSGLEFLRMDNESLISASALGNANGGNVTIDSTLIVATPPTGSQGSDIIANAEQGNGGRVNVTTQGLFGIQFRPQRTPKNDITVSSTFGLSGEYVLNTPGVDPSRGLAPLPTNVVDASQQIDRRCTPQAANQGSSFIITGRGGLPPNPNEPLQGESVITNWITLDSKAENHSPPATTTPKSSDQRQLVEAQGWIINEKGQVVLTAASPTATPQGVWLPEPNCNPPQTATVPQS